MKLKRCPFCDSDSIGIIEDWEGGLHFWAQCFDCDARTNEDKDFNIAGQYWNTRNGQTEQSSS
jgi:hypothetical protein